MGVDAMSSEAVRDPLGSSRGAGGAKQVLQCPQGPSVRVRDGQTVLNLSANDYLGLANHPSIIAAAADAMSQWGFGTASVRFICGTQEPHEILERAVADWLKVDDAIVMSSCFDANAGIFEALLGGGDAVVSDELNHASLIDGIRLCKASRLRYRNRDVADLETQLIEARRIGAQRVLVVTDGVFSMDGFVAPIDEICAVAARFDALVLVDDSHAVGVLGPEGRGTAARFGCHHKVDLVTGTFGKALGGAGGGYVAGRGDLIASLRTDARPYLFSNALAPPLVGGARAALELAATADELRQRVHENAQLLRRRLAQEDFLVPLGEHPIVPVMLGDDAMAREMSARLLQHGVFAVPMTFPVVPRGAARIRAQVSAAHRPEEVEAAVAAFLAARSDMNQRPVAQPSHDAR